MYGKNAHLAPDATDLGAVDGPLRPVDIGDALAEVKVGVIRGADTLELEERVVLVLVALAAGVPEDDTLGVQAADGRWMV